MSLEDPLANALVHIRNSDGAAKKECVLRPASKLLGEVLRIMKEQGFISLYEFVADGREGLYKVGLSGKINECKAIKPRYAVGKNEFEKFEKRYLPSRDLGVMIVSTSSGVITHKDAKTKAIGGRLLAYLY